MVPLLDERRASLRQYHETEATVLHGGGGCALEAATTFRGKCPVDARWLSRPIEIALTSKPETKYGHMSRIAAYSAELVHRVQVIGFVGWSGLSTIPRRHFQVTKKGRALNPLSVEMGAGPAQVEAAGSGFLRRAERCCCSRAGVMNPLCPAAAPAREFSMFAVTSAGAPTSVGANRRKAASYRLAREAWSRPPIYG